MITTWEAAAELGCSPQRVRQLLAQGRIRGAKRVVDRARGLHVWLMPEESLGEILPPARPRGRPRLDASHIVSAKARKTKLK